MGRIKGCWWGTTLLVLLFVSGCGVCEPGHIQPCDCDDGATGEAVCSEESSWNECVCPICEPGDTQECACDEGYAGIEMCTDNGLDWGSCECNDCAAYVDLVCNCEGAEEFYDALGTTCWDTYQPLIDLGDPEACELARDAFEAAGGCDQFGVMGDDDDTA